MKNNISLSESMRFEDEEFSNNSTILSTFEMEMENEDDDPTQYPLVKVILIALYSLVFATCFSGKKYLASVLSLSLSITDTALLKLNMLH